jgi:hypothetical protein
VAGNDAGWLAEYTTVPPIAVTDVVPIEVIARLFAKRCNANETPVLDNCSACDWVATVNALEKLASSAAVKLTV